MSTMIRRGITGLAVAGLLAGGALLSVAGPASAATAPSVAAPQSPMDDVIAGPFTSREQCEFVPVVVPGGAGCIYGLRRGQLAWWLVYGGGIST